MAAADYLAEARALAERSGTRDWLSVILQNLGELAIETQVLPCRFGAAIERCWKCSTRPVAERRRFRT